VAARVAKVVFDSNLACVAQPDDYGAFIQSHVCTSPSTEPSCEGISKAQGANFNDRR